MIDPKSMGLILLAPWGICQYSCVQGMAESKGMPKSTDTSDRSNRERDVDRVAKFNIGDLVVHKHQGYRAVIVDIDPLFQASGRYNPQACKREFSKRNPWYRLLVDESSQITYVEENLLACDSSGLAINNPNVDHYLIKRQGGYRSNGSCH